jgi:hypothetical protein
MIAIAVVAISFYAFMEVSGSQHNTETQALPKQVEAGIWLINIERFDLSTGNYNVDFYLWFRWDGNSTLPIDFEFMNGRATSVDVVAQRDGYYEVRVRGNFIKKLDFAEFPFDEHKLTIEIEDKTQAKDLLLLVPDNAESGIDDQINVPGWELKEWSIDTEEHKYPDEDFSRLIFSFTLARSPLSSILKTVVPIVIITTIAMLAFLVAPKNFAQRIGLGVTTLLAAVAAHLNLANQLPPIGYLTMGDKIMIIVYALFLHGLLTSVIIMRYVDKEKHEEASNLNRKSAYFIPIIIGAIFAVIFLV